MLRVFLTGATGYIGGEALYSIYNATSIRSQITVLVRDPQKAELVTSQFPGVRIVHGDLDNSDLIREESSRADAVFHVASTKHAASCNAIANGLQVRRNRPGYWIQMSGASVFSTPDIENGTYGEARPDVYRDVMDADKITSIIKSNPSRTVDQLVLSQDPSRVRTALVIGPLIYGNGHGPGNTTSIQLPELARNTLRIGQGFQNYFRSMLEAVASEKARAWNVEGVYFVENGKMSFGELSQAVAVEAHKQGLSASPEVSRSSDANEANEYMPHGAVLWGTKLQPSVKHSEQRLSLAGDPFTEIPEPQ
ncbi:Putative NAD(P)-binding domain, NAD(P)-binding domain superfamily [Septoria linicola]|uniref:NAD(P)-binding domain, NAD(P)-binding domain superfamily n=1 Tax=Septoria linicola TaxID=215465 RepID=A0A9Q9ELN1_9PEZI|nr:putative NAD(P)-binding domain, NAD(P)-binding domain superfamily [Septoria linicola]USW55245.1 Putative NAD(P)-binding domain, NAD(P)-binding domain superfamily [Septoria linicola]